MPPTSTVPSVPASPTVLPGAGVSCAWTRVVLEAAEALGFPDPLPDQWSSKGEVDLRDARRRIDWERFLEFMGSIRRAAPGRTELMRLGSSMGGGRSRSGWLEWLLGPALLYRVALGQAWPRILPGVPCVVGRPGPGRLVCDVRLPHAPTGGGGVGDRHADAAEAFLWITAGQLRTLASGILGGPPARVDTTLAADRRSARFEIHLPESRTLAARTARFLRILLASRKVARTLIGQHGELSQARLERDELHGEFEELMENAPDGILVHEDGRILYANPALARSLGVGDRDRLIGASIDAFLGFDDEASFDSVVNVGTRPEAGAVSLRGHRRAAGESGPGDPVFFDLACSKPIRFSGRRAQLVMVKDVTERNRLERQLMEAGDGERRKLAMDLHDGLGQLLSGIAFRAETLRQCLPDGDPERTGLARDLVRLSKQAMQQSRALARGLDPVGRFEGGLPVALENLSRLTREIHGVETTLANAIGDHLPIAPEREIQLYRIAQEATHNATRHAKPSRIEIGLAPVPGTGAVALTVRDDGRGFARHGDSDAAPPCGPGLGLRIMRFRAESIGADLSVDSAPGRGTTVACQFIPDGGGSRKAEENPEPESPAPRHG